MLDVAAVLGRFGECGDGRAGDEEREGGVPGGGDGRDGDAAEGAGEDGKGGLAGEAEVCVAGFVDGDRGAG